jgi:hypothetical protein
MTILSKTILARFEIKLASKSTMLLSGDESFHEASCAGCQSDHVDVHVVLERYTPRNFAIAGLLFWCHSAVLIRSQPALGIHFSENLSTLRGRVIAHRPSDNVDASVQGVLQLHSLPLPSIIT